MAESISEGTLKQWSKQIGDHVCCRNGVWVVLRDTIGLVAGDAECWNKEKKKAGARFREIN